MNIIDTEYKSLAEIDAEIVRFYREDKRTRTIGYDEEKDLPIEEEYIVIVLEKPNEVYYDYVSEKRGDRFGWDFVRGILERAITWEDYRINHDGYLKWLSDCEAVKEGQELPELPTIDVSIRRGFYEEMIEPHDANYETFTGTYERKYDDESYTVTLIPIVTAKSAEYVAVFHREQAKALRDEIKVSTIFFHGYHWQVRDKDRTNIDDALEYGRRKGMMDAKRGWITADNQYVYITYTQLEQIKDAYVKRLDELFKQYLLWCSGDMQQPFEFVDE
ncbi:DUF4376 domain-containing protein [Vibrio mediterranei]|uniref:DUF4376 domain-containing protein n=1 Tax=Vibrio mediterranei TaxID=689 RepID=UPI001EFDB8D3|nr:DUF4376 domain-containing protein [Vibrio mediterranei]MCG9624651.1 DUF4376 domain-containing protein [Vibrio mediterranei]